MNEAAKQPILDHLRLMANKIDQNELSAAELEATVQNMHEYITNVLNQTGPHGVPA